jgi:hypothetical protein
MTRFGRLWIFELIGQGFISKEKSKFSATVTKTVIVTKRKASRLGLAFS